MSKEFTVWDECKRLERELQDINARELKLADKLRMVQEERRTLVHGASDEALGILKLSRDGTPER